MAMAYALSMPEGKLEGFRINKVDNNKLFPQQAPPNIPPRATLYRNYDHEFAKLLADDLSGQREIDVTMRFYDTPTGFALTMEDTDWQAATCTVEWEHQIAKKPQHEAIQRQLAKLGGTGFRASHIDIDLSQAWVYSRIRSGRFASTDHPSDSKPIARCTSPPVQLLAKRKSAT